MGDKKEELKNQIETLKNIRADLWLFCDFDLVISLSPVFYTEYCDIIRLGYIITEGNNI